MSPASRTAHERCLCCQSSTLDREWGVTSSFFAQRALLRDPEVVPLLHCTSCRTRFFELAVSANDLGRLYADYRGEAYLRQRQRFEPWYSRAYNDSIGGDTEMRARREVLRAALAESGVGDRFQAVLDHGGDRGQMLLDLKAPRLAVFEISGAAPEPGVTSIDLATMQASNWDLILSCHVLEHVPDPRGYIGDLVALGQPGTTFFLEVPNETFRSFAFNRSDVQRAWIAWVATKPSLFKLFDFLSSGVRIKLRAVPPLLFVALREHLTFFTIAGLTHLLQDAGLTVLSAKIRATGHIAVVAIKQRAGAAAVVS